MVNAEVIDQVISTNGIIVDAHPVKEVSDLCSYQAVVILARTTRSSVPINVLLFLHHKNQH